MKYKTLVKQLSLSQADLSEIQAAVQEAEKTTSGEIALAVTAESSSYAFWELVSSLFSTFLLLICLFPLSSQIYSWLGNIFWGEEPWYLAAFYVAVCVVVLTCLYALYNIPFIDRLVIPANARHAAVSRRAMRYFAESGVYATREHSGVLIFVSWFEKEVRIVSDSGISEKISPDLWNLIADDMADAFLHGDTKSAFLGAISRCSALLSENFPAKEENPNELADGLVILEDEKWV